LGEKISELAGLEAGGGGDYVEVWRRHLGYVGGGRVRVLAACGIAIYGNVLGGRVGPVGRRETVSGRKDGDAAGVDIELLFLEKVKVWSVPFG